MSLDLYMPIARHSVDILLLLGLGAVIGSFSGIFGIGGGFLLTPLLIMAGIPPIVAAASDSNQIIAAATSGSYAHYRMGHVDLKMGILLLLGNLVGGTLGVEIIKILRRMGEAGFLIKITYVVLLSIVGSYMLVESIKSLRKAAAGKEKGPASSPLYLRLGQSLPWQMYFEKSGVALSPLLPLFLGGFVGLLAGIMGLGGGFIMVPLMFYLLGMPMHLVVGTNLFQEAFLCANVTFVQVLTNHAVDLMLALALAVGSGIGAQFGSRLSRKVRGEQLRFLLAVIILAVMIKILLGLILHPHYILDMKGIG
jgi:uncharacterized membrane protein YfcA